MRTLLTTTVVVLAVASVSAHIMVSPPESKAGVTQKYELRVHNEEKLATAEVVLDIPDGITVLSIGTAPAGTLHDVEDRRSDRRIDLEGRGSAWKVCCPALHGEEPGNCSRSAVGCARDVFGRFHCRME